MNEFRTKKESCSKISARSLSTSKTDSRWPGGLLICANSFPPNHIDAHAANAEDLKCLCMIFPIFRFACFGHSFFSTLFWTLWSSHANIHRIGSFNSVGKNEINRHDCPMPILHVEVDLKLNERWDDDRNRNFSRTSKDFIFQLRAFQLNSSIPFNGLHWHPLIAYFIWDSMWIGICS